MQKKMKVSADALTAGEAPAVESAGWRDIESAPKDGTPILVARHIGDPWGWVYGWSRWVDVYGVVGWLSHGFHEIPGDLGLGNPDVWRPIPMDAESHGERGDTKKGGPAPSSNSSSAVPGERTP